MPTKGSYKGTVQGHTSVTSVSESNALGERPRTDLLLLALQPVLVEMTWGTMSRHDYWEGLWVLRKNVSRGAYICDSGERWLLIRNDEQLDITEIDPAVRSSVAWHWVAWELCSRLHEDQIKLSPSHSHNYMKRAQRTEWCGWFFVVKVVGSAMATPRDPTSQCPDSTGGA